MEEKWIKWEPADGLSGTYRLESLCNNGLDGFKIVLVSSGVFSGGKKVEVSFGRSDAFMRSRRTFAEQEKAFLASRYGVELYRNWAFFRVTDSAYLHWISDQSSTISDSYGVMHFAFITDDSIIDALCAHEPKVTLLWRMGGI